MIEERCKSNTIGAATKNLDATLICALHVETRMIKDYT